MHVRGTTIGLAGATALAVGLAMVPVGSAATADPSARKVTLVTDYEMPFPCGQTWSGTSRRNHSPSSLAIDWNRADDIDDPVVASAPGVVTTADKVDNSGYGRWVVIDHGNGEDSLYAHLRTITVTVGQRVDQGMQIGTVGSTGNSTGATCTSRSASHARWCSRSCTVSSSGSAPRWPPATVSTCPSRASGSTGAPRPSASIGVPSRPVPDQRPDGSTLAKQMAR